MTAASAAVLVALVGLAAVLAVQSRANATSTAKNAELDRANADLRESNARRTRPTPALAEANGRVQARFDLAREAIRSFQAGVNEDEMLKERASSRPLRDKLLRSAAGFYDKLGDAAPGPGRPPPRRRSWPSRTPSWAS